MKGFSEKLRASAAVGTLAVLLFSAIGCGNAPGTPHPGQINALDGDTYDSLTAAHAALGTLKTQVQTSFPEYTAQFNQAAAAYQTAYASYALFRTAPTSNQAQLAMVMQNLTVAIVSLEDSFAIGMHANPKVVETLRGKAATLRARAKASGFTISDILTELEIAASIAATIPGTQPYSTIAQMVLQATSSAVSALTTMQGMPIDLNTIQPIPPITVK